MTDHTRYEGDPARVALLLPGGGYTPARPLLHYASAVLTHHGWTVQEIWYPDTIMQDMTAAAEGVRDLAEQAVARESAQRLLLVGKSLGTFATGLAAERDLPAIWLTPILTNTKVVDGLSRTTAPTLLIGGTGDRMWDGEVARRTAAEVLEIPAADHGMQTSEPAHSVDILRQVVVAMDDFVGRL